MVYEGLCGEISIFLTGQRDGQNRLLTELEVFIEHIPHAERLQDTVQLQST